MTTVLEHYLKAEGFQPIYRNGLGGYLAIGPKLTSTKRLVVTITSEGFVVGTQSTCTHNISLFADCIRCELVDWSGK